MRPTASVVVPFAGPEHELEALVRALARLALGPGDEILLADNRREPAPPSWVPDGLVHLDASGPATPYHARNVAAGRARGEWLVFLDGDVRPPGDLLDRLLDPAPADDVGVLAGGVRDVAPRRTRISDYVSARRKMDARGPLGHPFAPFAQTAHAAVRRTAFEAVGGFEPRVRSGGDADLSWRAQTAGWKLEARLDAEVVHLNRTRLRPLLKQIARHGSGMAWLDDRHPGSMPWRPRELLGVVKAFVVRPGGDRLIDVLTTVARDLGRLRDNRAS